MRKLSDIPFNERKQLILELETFKFPKELEEKAKAVQEKILNKLRKSVSN